MEQGPSLKAKTYTSIKKIPLFLLTPKIHHRAHKSKPIVHILKLSQTAVYKIRI